MSLRPAAVVLLALTPGWAIADPFDDFWVATRMADQIAVIRDEGLAASVDIADGLFPGGMPQGWSDAVARIYAPEALEAALRSGLQTELDDADLPAITAFFLAAPGATFLDLELSTRRALLDPDVEAMANESAAVAFADETPRAQLIGRFIAANDIIETNIISAMNSQIAFFSGIAAGGGMQGQLTEDQIIDEVMNREAEIRASTTEWAYSFLLMAYGPMSDADLEAYIAWSETEAGQDWNRAMFAAFDDVFNAISGDLGAAAAGFMVTQEL
jgi:hypothetical protein